MGIGSPSSLLRTKDVENHIAYLSDKLIYDCFLRPFNTYSIQRYLLSQCAS